MRLEVKNLVVPIIWALVILFNIQNFFFWDTIQLASKHAHFFYDTEFSSFFLPEGINSGHPPFFGMALAGLWSIFGQHLIVGHIFMLFFVLGTMYQAHFLGKKLLGKESAFLLPLILFCNPVFLGHSILVSPDNVLLFLLLLCINATLTGKNFWLGLGCIFLAMLSMRGMMVVFGLFAAQLIYHKMTSAKLKPQIILPYLPAGLLALIFFIAHYLKNSWLGFHEESPWQESFDLVTIKGYAYNLGLVAWRLLDFGNVFIVLPLLYLFWKFRLRLNSEHNLFLFALLIAFSLIFILPLSAFKYLSAHRYFFPIYLVLSILLMKLMLDGGFRKMTYVLLLFLFLGNWWIYPRSVSQGWDVSLAHLPFYEMTKKMDAFLEESDVAKEEIGTQFPLKSEEKYLFLNQGKKGFKEADLKKDQYILYSKIMNDFKDVDYYYLQEKFTLVTEFNRMGIDLKLYERR